MQENRLTTGNLSRSEQQVFDLLTIGGPMPFQSMRRPLGIDFEFNSKEAERTGGDASRYPHMEQMALDRMRDALTTLIEDGIVQCFVSRGGIVMYHVDPLVALSASIRRDEPSSIG